MRAPHETPFDHALDNATHLALAALGLRAEDMIDTADILNNTLEPIFRNWCDVAGTAGLPEEDAELHIHELSILEMDENILEDRINAAAMAAVGAFGIDPDYGYETTDLVLEAIAGIVENLRDPAPDCDC